MPGRTYTNGSSYRYSINGQEKTPEIAPNTTTAEFWQYDSRMARRWNVDPRPNVSISPYNCFAGNPIFYPDNKGDSIPAKFYDEKGNQLAKGIFDKTRKKDHIKITVEGMKHDGKVLVRKMTEE